MNKIVKGPDRGRILTDWEVDEMEEDDDREENEWEKDEF